MAKRIFVATAGSRGDVEPFLALCKTLKQAGYDVVLSAPPDFSAWIAAHGVAHHAVGEPAQDVANAFAKAIERDKFFVSLARAGYEEKFRAAFESISEASQGADLLIYSPIMTSVSFLAEARKTPAVAVYLAPAFPTRDFAAPVFGRLSYGPLANRLSHRAVDLILFNMFRPWWNAVRGGLPGLRPFKRFHNFRSVNGKPVPHVIAVSEAILPRPRDWPPHAVMTGNFFLDGDENWEMPADLAAFIEAGPPPIYIGFGSMPLGQSKKKMPVLLNALRLSRQRAVICRGWGAWTDAASEALGSRVHVIDAAPHRKLFPHVAGVVHHGGAGTTAAGLLAGKPTLATPLILDQYFFGHLVHRRGAGPKPLPVKRWRTETLAERLKDVTRVADYQRRAADISKRMAMEDGRARALDVVANIIGAP